jgi:hypothetical protein
MVSNFTAQLTASSTAMHGHGGILGETDSPELQEAPLLSCESEVADKGFWTKLKDAIHQFIEELMAPPTISAVCFRHHLASHFAVARSWNWKDQI